MTVDIEVKGLSRWVRSGILEAGHVAQCGEYGGEWVDGRIGGDERNMNDGCGVENGMYGLKIVLGPVAETTNGAAFMAGVGEGLVHGG